MRFLQVGKIYEVVTHPENNQTLSGMPHVYHMFPQGTTVLCTEVYPVGHPLNLRKRLMGVFEGQMEVQGSWTLMDQELSVTDVKRE